MHGSLGASGRVARQEAENGVSRAPLVVCTFGRSGTHLLIDMIRRQFAAFDAWHLPGERLNGLYLSTEAIVARMCSEARVAQIVARSRRTLVKSHDWPAAVPAVAAVAPTIATWLRRADVVYVVREPRAALTRLWESAFIPDTCGESPDDFIAEQARRWADHVEVALGDPRALLFNFEAVLTQPAQSLARLAAFTGETARHRPPLLVTPHCSRWSLWLARLAVRPQSTHILPDARWRKPPLDWTPARLALLRAVAGNTASRVGYSPG